MSFLWGLVLTLNVLWFGAGFVYFTLMNRRSAALLVPRSARDSPLFESIVAAMRFLGGFNLALCLFALAILVVPGVFDAPLELALVATLFSIAHGSQFEGNVPVALGGGRIGEKYWPVLHGPMLFIFVVDGALCLANAAFAMRWLSV